MYKGIEKRRFPRVQFPCKVSVVQERCQTIVTHTENLGCGGMRILVEQEIPLAKTVRVELFIERKKKITADVKVVWSIAIKNPCDHETVLFDIGLEFVDITDAQKKEVERLVCALIDDDHA